LRWSRQCQLPGSALTTAANDAGLIAQTLQAAGFDVVALAISTRIRCAGPLRDFLDKAAASGPDTVRFCLCHGYGLQLEGENLSSGRWRIGGDLDVSVEALRIPTTCGRLPA